MTAKTTIINCDEDQMKTPTWDDVLNQMLSEMRDEGIRIIDDAIGIMEPLQRRNFECAAKYDELLLLRKNAETMPNNCDEALIVLASTEQLYEAYVETFAKIPDHEELDAIMTPLSISEYRLRAFVKWLNKETECKWTTEDAYTEVANQTSFWKIYNIDKSLDTPPSEEFCQAMWGVSSIEELHEHARRGY